MTHLRFYLEAQEQLTLMHVAEAKRLFDLAERANHDPDLCAAGRWTCHMLEGNFELAWRESDAIASRGKPDPHRFWDGEPLDDRDVIVRCLHGLGDTIQFVRYAPLIRQRARRLTIEVQPQLKPLLEECRMTDEVITWGEREPAWNQQIEIVELPRVFRTRVETIPGLVPYLHLASGPLPGGHDRSRPLRVGLVWAASDYNKARSIPTEQFSDLLRLPGISFFSLQAGRERNQIDYSSSEVVSLCGESSDVLGTVKALQSVDLVITVDTMVAHLAGALARPVWTLLMYQCDWRWMLEREDSPWYPTMRLFRQPKPGDWVSVVARVKRELKAQVGATQVQGAGHQGMPAAPSQALEG